MSGVERQASVVWVVRHGNRQDFEDPDWHRTADHPYDPPLSENGRRQARETGRRLRQEKIDHIWSSPFLRCVETAQLIAEEMKGRFKLEEGLSEWLNAEWFAHRPRVSSSDHLQPRYPRLDVQYRSAVPVHFPESREMMLARVAEAVQHLIRLVPGRILLVGHGASVQGIIAHLLQIDLSESENLFLSIPCCSLAMLYRQGDSWSLQVHGDIDHLSHISAGQRFI